MYYWSGAVLLDCTRLHCSDLYWSAGFSYTLYPTALTCTAFCALDCTAPTCNELYGSFIYCTLLYCPALHFDELHCYYTLYIFLLFKLWYYYTALDSTSPTCPALKSSCLQFTGVQLHSTLRTAIHCTAKHCTALHCTALHCTALHWTALHYCTALHCTALHFTALHNA